MKSWNLLNGQFFQYAIVICYVLKLTKHFYEAVFVLRSCQSQLKNSELQSSELVLANCLPTYLCYSFFVVTNTLKTEIKIRIILLGHIFCSRETKTGRIKHYIL